MFDRIENKTGPQYPQRVTVVEQRAPTDATVRLLKDLEREAQKKILDSIRLDSNVFKGVVHKKEDFNNAQIILLAMFELNGRRHEVEHRISSEAFDKEHHMRELLRKCAEKIVSEMLPDWTKILRGDVEA